MTQIDEPNLDKELIQLLFGDEGIIETDGSNLMDRIRHAQLSKLEKAKALIATQIQEARLDELEHLLKDYDIEASRATEILLNDRIAQLRSTPNV